MDGIARSDPGAQGYGYDSSSSVNELHSMDDDAARAPPGRAGFLPVMIPLIPRWPVRIECATPPDSPSIPRIRQPASSRAPREGRPRATRTRLSRCCDVGHGRLFRGRPGASSLPRREWSGRGRRGGRVLRSVRRLPARRPPRPACGGSLSKSATKAPIEPERARRNVDIPRFSSRPIPARSAFVADLDTPPPRVATGAPPAPHRHPRTIFFVPSHGFCHQGHEATAFSTGPARLFRRCRRGGGGAGSAGQAPIRSRSRYWSRARSSARVRGSACARRDSACGRGSAGACDSDWRISPRLGPPGPRRQTRHPSVSWVCWASSAAREGSVKRRPSASVRYPLALRTASWLMPRRALRHTRAAGVSTLEATTARARAAGAPGATVGLAPSTGAAER